ncbi:MAG TPA: LPS assembly lipoprotein LptE [Gemmatimonadaceae bacterium]|nr:LPS assembly lipoprotein LptE [Gemmatimonadaceae bacterium]
MATVLAAGLSTGCLYHFNGGGLPPDVKTIAVVPFDNQTPVSDLQREISDSISTRLLNKLGLRNAPVDKANAVVRGTIRRYEVDIPVGYSANTQVVSTAQRQLEMVLDIDVTDQVTGKTLWSRKGFVVDGQYQEQGEAQGRSQAIDIIVNTIVEGMQSQW